MSAEIMNKAEFIEAIAGKLGTSKAETERFVNAYQEVITDTVADGKAVRLTNFISVKSVITAARMGRNPQTGEAIPIPEAKRVKVTPLKGLRDSVK